MLTFILYVILAPFFLVALFIAAMLLLTGYYYIKAWLTGTRYAKTIPDPVLLSQESLGFLGYRKKHQDG